MQDEAQAAELLSKRELEVAAAYAEGLSYKEIARDLGVSPTTIRSHLRTVYGKLGVTSKIALSQALIDPKAASEAERDAAALTADLALELDDAMRRERMMARVLRLVSRRDADLDAVIDEVIDQALDICEAEFGILFEHHGDLRFSAMRSRNIAPAFASWLAERGEFAVDPATGLGRVAETLSVVNIADVRGEEAYSERASLRVATAELGGARSFAAIPMVSGDRLIGAFTVYRTRVHPFNDRALELAQAFADQAAIAIENVRQFRELETRLEREAVNRRILQVISESRDDEQPVFDAIIENACRLCAAPMGAFVLGREGGGAQVMVAQQGITEATLALYRSGLYTMEPGTSYAGAAIIERRTFQLEDMAATEPYLGGDARFRSLVDEQGIRTVLYVPLISQGEGIGCLILFRPVVRPYTADEIALVQTFAEQAVIAIENVRQFRALQNRLARAAASREILEAIRTSREDAAPVFDVILKHARRLCDAPFAALALGKEGDAHQVMAAHHGAAQSTEDIYREGGIPMDPVRSFAARSIIEKRAIHLADMRDTEEYRAGYPNVVALCDNQGIRTNLFVPLISNGEGIGCFIIFRREIRPYMDDQISLVETFAAQAVIALENVRQFRELQARLERAAATREVLEAISASQNDEAPVFDVIMRRAAQLCGADAAAMTLGRAGEDCQSLAAALDMHPATRALYAEGKVSMNPETSLVARAIVQGRTLHVPDYADTDDYRAGEEVFRSLVDDTGMRTSINVPMLSGGKGIGALVLYRKEVRPYTPDEIAQVETFAAQAVIALENVQQFRALEARTAEVQALNASLEEKVAAQVGEIERVGRLKQFLSPAVAEVFVSQGEERRLASHRALIATLFCDIRGFTAFCETAEPEETIEVLQAYHEEMGNLISAHGGGVDKRMGDGIMVIFNDPMPCDDPAGDAVRLAIAMRERMRALCGKWRRLGHRLGFGVGISFGYATVGMVGSAGRFDYTASGTSVNTAARPCDIAGDDEILLSPRAFAAVEDAFAAESRGAVEIKGIREPMEIFALCA